MSTPGTRQLLARQILTLLFLWGISGFATSEDCIGVVTGGAGDAFWEEVGRGATSASHQFSLRAHVRGPRYEGDADGQAQIIQSMTEEQACVGLILAPQSASQQSLVDDLMKRGIPVVNIDRDFGGSRRSVIATNNLDAGRYAAEQVKLQLPAGSIVAIAGLTDTVVSTVEREQGFRESMEGSGFTVLATWYLGNDPAAAMDTAFRYLKTYKDVDALFSTNESTTIATLRARQRLTSEKRLVHLGFDMSTEIRQAILDGQLLGTIIQDPFQMGYLSVEILSQILHHESVPERVDTPVDFLNKDRLLSP